MKRKILFFLILLIAIAGGGFLVWKTFFGESEEDIIRRRLNEVTRTFGKAGNEGFLVQMESARKITRYFDEICDVRLPKFHREAKMTKDHITQNAIMVRKFSKTLELQAYDLEFFFPEGEEKDRCRLLFTGMVNANLNTGERFREAYDLEIHWVKKEGEWLIEGIGFSGILHR